MWAPWTLVAATPLAPAADVLGGRGVSGMAANRGMECGWMSTEEGRQQ